MPQVICLAFFFIYCFVLFCGEGGRHYCAPAIYPNVAGEGSGGSAIYRHLYRFPLDYCFALLFLFILILFIWYNSVLCMIFFLYDVLKNLFYIFFHMLYFYIMFASGGWCDVFRWMRRRRRRGGYRRGNLWWCFIQYYYLISLAGIYYRVYWIGPAGWMFIGWRICKCQILRLCRCGLQTLAGRMNRNRFQVDGSA